MIDLSLKQQEAFRVTVSGRSVDNIVKESRSTVSKNAIHWWRRRKGPKQLTRSGSKRGRRRCRSRMNNEAGAQRGRHICMCFCALLLASIVPTSTGPAQTECFSTSCRSTIVSSASQRVQDTARGLLRVFLAIGTAFHGYDVAGTLSPSAFLRLNRTSRR